MDKENEELTIFKACMYAFLGKDTAFYPRTADGKWIKPSSIFGYLPTEVPTPPEDYEKHLALAKASLDEVKALTEYQDQKIARLLTIISFLTAAAGVVFTKFIDMYPLHDVIDRSAWLTRETLVLFTYALFFLFLLFVALGALIAFHASRTRFVWDRDTLTKDDKPGSYLFYRGIIESTPAFWVKGFWGATKTVGNSSDAVGNPPSNTPNPTADDANPARDADKASKNASNAPNCVGNSSSASFPSIEALQFEYLKNYVGETYLVAAKVADKVRILEPAQKLLSYAIRVLVVLLIVFAWTLFAVRPAHVTKSIDAQSATAMAPSNAPASVNKVTGDAQTAPAMTLRLEVVPSPAVTSNSTKAPSTSEQRVESMPSSAASR